jgi:hypothetical protein
MAKRHDAAVSQAGINKFALLDGLEVSDASVSLAAKPRRKSRTKKAPPPPNAAALHEPWLEAPPQIEKLDTELLSVVFAHLHNGPLVGRLRLVRVPFPPASTSFTLNSQTTLANKTVRGRYAEVGAG